MTRPPVGGAAEGAAEREIGTATGRGPGGGRRRGRAGTGGR